MWVCLKLNRDCTCPFHRAENLPGYKFIEEIVVKLEHPQVGILIKKKKKKDTFFAVVSPNESVLSRFTLEKCQGRTHKVYKNEGY